MSLTLVRKELREHGPVLLGAALLGGLALFALIALADKSGAGRFTALLRFAPSIGVLNALVAANRLLVHEYAGRTQLFLEVLPISRTRVFATKWLLGWLWTVALLAVAWAAVLNHARVSEVIAFTDALPVLAAVVLFGTGAWSFAAMAGMLGRYRYTAWIATLLAFGAAADAGKLSAEELPLFALLGDRVAMARGGAESEEIVAALGISVVFTAGACALALVGSGGIAATLARRMTARERVFLLVSSLVIAFVHGAIEGEREKPAFAVSDALIVEGLHGRIALMATADVNREQMMPLSQKLADDVDAAFAALALAHSGPGGNPTKPTIYVLPQQGLDARVVERASLGLREGIVLRAAPSVQETVLRARVLHELVIDASKQRALREDRHVLLDGFAEWLALKDAPTERALHALRLASIEQPITAARLARWEESMEQLGPCVASALAFASVAALIDTLGQARSQALLSALFAPQPEDVRVLLEETPSAQLARAGASWQAVAARVEAERLRLQKERAGELVAIPKRGARIDVQRSVKRGVRVQGRVRGATAFRLMYAALGPWTRVPPTPTRLDVRGAAETPELSGTLPVSLPSGSRLFAAIEVDEPALQCPRRLHAQRLVLP